MNIQKFLKILFIYFILLLTPVKSFASINETDFINQGNSFLEQAISNQYPELNSMYLLKAQYYFYVASKNTPPSVDALIGLGRVYTLQNKQEDAKNTLFEAYSLDPYNADANFYFAEFWYKYSDFKTALKYYIKAYTLNYKDRTTNYEMIKKCYAKLGDEESIENLK